MKTAFALLITTACAIGQAHASSGQAWKDLDKAVLAGCQKASQLKDPTPVGTPARFDDRTGFDAVLLQGRYPQKHMNNRQGRELCLYQRKTGSASVTEWDSIQPR
ncbi:hypothetical protein IFR09_13405 [Pseudomonas syringae]|nr:hypothetical protein [Pseudomonas syringae]MBD8574970.1 hypothetical protein [Pseudomonas syringae]MBD8789590.1 hypothetical protein [Pseudomonas syringae]MBD8800779.1 hypothetical protein [Pseudomonas syringae]MBD8812160.1 hypothetical protein [Pseudomonas syringae]